MQEPVERQRAQVEEPAVPPEREVRLAARHPDARERRGRERRQRRRGRRDSKRCGHFPPRTPPSTKSALPMTKRDSSEARNSAANATSSGFPSSAVSWRLRISLRPSSRFGYDSRRYFSTNGVWIVPGSRAFTRMPNDA